MVEAEKLRLGLEPNPSVKDFPDVLLPLGHGTPNMQRSIDSTTTRQKGQAINSTGLRENPLLRPSRRQYPPHAHQRHRIAAGTSNPRDTAANPTTPRLHSNTRGGHHHVLSKRHDTSGPQQCRLPQRTQSQKPSKRTLLPLHKRGIRPTTVPSSTLHTSSNTSCHQQLRQSSQHFTSWLRRLYTLESFSRRWATNNMPHQSRPTMPWQRQ